jgi:hypothetical protein
VPSLKEYEDRFQIMKQKNVDFERLLDARTGESFDLSFCAFAKQSQSDTCAVPILHRPDAAHSPATILLLKKP